MALQIARAVFALAIRLINRLAVDEGTRSAGALEVSIDIINIDKEPRVPDILGSRSVEMMLCGHSVQPHRRISGADLAMDCLAIGASLDTSRNEPEGLNQEVMRGRDVLIRQNRDDPPECRHERAPSLLSASRWRSPAPRGVAISPPSGHPQACASGPEGVGGSAVFGGRQLQCLLQCRSSSLELRQSCLEGSHLLLIFRSSVWFWPLDKRSRPSSSARSRSPDQSVLS
jgi:hypothetical protein